MEIQFQYIPVFLSFLNKFYRREHFLPTDLYILMQDKK